MRMTANEVQNILGVEDLHVIAYGYTFERKTVEIYFQAGQIVRRVNGLDEWSSTMFEPSMFERNIKRFYEQGVCPILANLFDTFNYTGLSLTPQGGRAWGYYIGEVWRE